MNWGFLSGDPVDRVWVAYVGVGSTGVGLLSVDSTGPPVILIPMFIGAAIASLIGAIRRSQAWGIVGLGLASLSGWLRAAALWGVEQHGAGSTALATFVWLWIATGCALLSVALGKRGMQ